MRENYRPDLQFHASDGVHHTGESGSDGSLRLPPMSFEPLINMADAVRQPRPKLAHTAAWLGVITADMPMQNWCHTLPGHLTPKRTARHSDSGLRLS